MPFLYNPLQFSGFSLTSAGGGNPNFSNPVATETDLPSPATPGELVVVKSTDHIYVYDGTLNKWVDTGLTPATFGNTPNADGYSLVVDQSGTIVRNEIVLQPADATHPGSVSTGTQTLGGDKTFNGAVNVEGILTADNDAIINGVLQPYAGVDVVAGHTLLLGTSTADAVHIGTVGKPIVLESATTANQTITSNGAIYAQGGVDTAGVGQTLSIGSGNASVINIGNSGATVNIQGTTIYENTPQLLTADPLITVNHGGASGSGQNAGIQVEEAGSITGYNETSSDRNSWTLKAPNTSGIATITPGSAGITLNQSSHDPVTLTAVGSSPNANAASLSSQALTLQPADTTNPGVITAGTQTIGGAKTFPGGITTTVTGHSTLDVATSSLGNLTDAGTDGIVVTGGSGSVVGSVSLAQHVADTTHNGYLSSTDWNTFNGKLATTLTSGAVFIGNVSNVATANFISGDATITNTGALTIGANAVTNSKQGQMAANTIKANNSGVSASPSDLTASQVNTMLSTITSLTGDVTATGTGTFAAATIAANVVTNAKAAQMPANTIKGNNTGSTANASDLTVSQAQVLLGITGKSAGDISETSFTAADNQAVAANITGFSFANATVRSFEAIVSIVRSSTYAQFKLLGIQKGSSWEMDQNFVGDDAGLVFSITTAGTVQYTSTSTGSTALVKFRALTTSL